MRAVSVLLTLLVSTFAHAFNASHWVEVFGGVWHPDRVLLANLDAALESAVTVASKGRGPMQKWKSYTFQFQGRRSLLGSEYVFINAFCGAATVDVHATWFEVLDGGTCYFSAKYDPKNNRVYDVQVSGLG